jgi:hypothetical protein
MDEDVKLALIEMQEQCADLYEIARKKHENESDMWSNTIGAEFQYPEIEADDAEAAWRITVAQRNAAEYYAEYADIRDRECGVCANNISDWRDACEAMQVQALGDMSPTERAAFILAAAAHRDAMRAPWPAAQAAEAARLRDEFCWLYTAAVTLQEQEGR